MDAYRKETGMYTAAVLKPTSAALLKWILRATINLETQGFCLKTQAGEPLPHHMTINMGSLDQSLNPPALLGANVLLCIDGLVYDTELGVCAAPVVFAKWSTAGHDREIQTCNVYPHITVCLKPPNKPVLSNTLLKKGGKVHVLDEMYKLEAVVQEC